MATQTQNDYGAWGLLGADDQKICDYEGILEVSNSSTSQVLTEPIENGQLAAKVLDKYMQDFQRRNPTLRVI